MRKTKKIIFSTMTLASLFSLASCEINFNFFPTNTETKTDTKSENKSTNNNSKTSYIDDDTSESKVITELMYEDFSIHFMMLGNASAGDSIYIKAGDNDILIDAGSQKSSSTTLISYIDEYCTDKKLEYVIATHGDSDHISAFPSIFDYYSVDTVIDSTYTTKTTTTYKNYVQARESAKNHYTTKECWNNENGAQRKYILGTGNNGAEISFELLYNYYYFNAASDENNNSVVTMFNYGDKHFFLGGDLEKEGEEKLAEYYDGSTEEKTLPQVELYKAGHHGSKTSSNDCLLSLIRPKMSVVSCCCGTDEYTGITDNQFPTQDYINRIAKYTDSVYVTSTYESYEIATAEANAKGQSKKTGVAVGGQYIHTTGYKPMNGNVCVSTNGHHIGLYCSNNYIKLKDTEWFNTSVTIDGVTRTVRKMPDEWK